MDNSKPFYVSKTMIAAVIAAAAPFIPYGVGPVIAAWISANPETYAALVGAVFGGLRLITDSGVTVR